MRVALVTLNYNKQGGIERCVAELAERLVREHEVHLFAGSFKDVNDPRFIIHKVPVIKRPHTAKVASFFLLSGHFLKKNSFDIFHAESPTATKVNVIRAHSVHRVAMNIQIKDEKSLAKKLKMRIATTFLNILIFPYQYDKGKFNKIIAISEGIKRELMDSYGVPAEKIIVIPHGVNLEQFHPRNRKLYRESTRKKYNLEEKDAVLLFVGKEFYRKGLESIVKAMSLLKRGDVKLLVVGQDMERPKYVRMAKSLNLTSNVIFCGHSAEVEAFYAASDIFVFPTMYEPFGLVILEAMASGLPVIISRLAGASDLIEDGINGFLLSDPSDVIFLSKKIEELVNDPLTREKMGRGARRIAEGNSWDRVYERIVKMYDEVLVENGGMLV